MPEVQKILIPVNFSEDSADGLKYAVSLAKETQAELLVLHVAQKKEAETFLGLSGRDGRIACTKSSRRDPPRSLVARESIGSLPIYRGGCEKPRPAENQ